MDAVRRARRLLWGYLSMSQRAQYLRRGYFEVRGSSGGRFRIYRRRPQTVLDQTGPWEHCVRTAYFKRGLGDELYPNEDQILALKLMIETDEPGFRRLCCVRPAYSEDYNR